MQGLFPIVKLLVIYIIFETKKYIMIISQFLIVKSKLTLFLLFKELQEDTSPKYEAEATTYRQKNTETANPKTGPVTFEVPEQQVEDSDR